MTDETARAMRGLWFAFLDEIEPLRPKLHAYCLRLTGSIFDAEDLAQETLLRAFAAIGQGDLSAGASPISNARAWLSRIATNLWIDSIRAADRRTATAEPHPPPSAAEPAVVTAGAAGAALRARRPAGARGGGAEGRVRLQPGGDRDNSRHDDRRGEGGAAPGARQARRRAVCASPASGHRPRPSWSTGSWRPSTRATCRRSPRCCWTAWCSRRAGSAASAGATRSGWTSTPSALPPSHGNGATSTAARRCWSSSSIGASGS